MAEEETAKILPACASWSSFLRSCVARSKLKLVISGFVNISSETVLEKLSQLNDLCNYGDR